MLIRVQFNITDQSFRPTFANLQRSPPEYDNAYNGEYEVTPLVDKETTLPTANKIMTKDVVVKQVPYFETSNNTGGETVYIGKVE